MDKTIWGRLSHTRNSSDSSLPALQHSQHSGIHWDLGSRHCGPSQVASAARRVGRSGLSCLEDTPAGEDALLTSAVCSLKPESRRSEVVSLRTGLLAPPCAEIS